MTKHFRRSRRRPFCWTAMQRGGDATHAQRQAAHLGAGGRFSTQMYNELKSNEDNKRFADMKYGVPSK